MFLPTRTCWNHLQKSLAEYSKADAVRYILKVDVANCFGSLNQHTLINLLNDSGYPRSLSSRLEVLMASLREENEARVASYRACIPPIC
jgi:hypothetical protein